MKQYIHVLQHKSIFSRCSEILKKINDGVRFVKKLKAKLNRNIILHLSFLICIRFFFLSFVEQNDCYNELLVTFFICIN